ncbi:hypothetical protein BB558_003341 [Smittium angustum]|uniref:Trafficking protein particle complex subunit n=1 Tax=Smittium angustum TaxID=133377 RepID=A0A2U1J6C2_SMIAN|nr:hypothetical protein BB558_003341 [Smittium angustum]
MSTTYYFVIVGTNDSPIYEAEIGNSIPESTTAKKDEYKHLNQFIIHSALDLVDDAIWESNNCFLKVVDCVNDWNVSAYVTPSNVRLMLLHEAKNEERIKLFFQETHELYVKTLLNPFYELNSEINSSQFDISTRKIAKKYLL